jgi:NAD(P)-dependent dehydrogenase (short-subunit alcohol dehydrogenase family)
MTQALEGKVALVTGAASGIGRSIALLLARQGAEMVLVDRDAAGLAETGKHTGGHQIVADLADPAVVVRAGAEAVERPGGVDILVNAAGITGSGVSLLDTPLEVWNQVHAVNCTAPFLLTQAVGRGMVARGRGGRIVNITSSSAHRALQSKASYGSSKAALAQLTRIAAAELGPYDINVNAVAPGLTRTPIVARAFTPDELAAALTQGPLVNLLHRISEPEDIAEVVLFLCLPASRQITGQTVHVSAGAIV